MAVESTMLSLGTPAPDFDLPDTVGGGRVKLADLNDKKALVVIFLCNHCPYVKHVQQGLVDFGNDYADRDVAIVAIGSNDADNYPDLAYRTQGLEDHAELLRLIEDGDVDGAVAEAQRHLNWSPVYTIDEDHSVFPNLLAEHPPS